MSKNKLEISLSTLIRDFFCRRLIAQRNASSQTIAGYRDTLATRPIFEERAVSGE